MSFRNTEIISSSRIHGMPMFSDFDNVDPVLCFENDENNLYNIVFSLNKIELLSYSSTLAPLTSDINQ